MKNTVSRPRRSRERANARTLNAVSCTGLAAWNFLSDIGRQQLAMTTQSTSAIYRGHEALRKIHQETAHDASLRHAQAARKLLTPCQPADLMSIQSDLLCTDMDRASQYWRQLTAAALRTQREMITSMGHLLDSESDTSMKSALEVFEAAMPAMAVANPLVAARPAGARA